MPERIILKEGAGSREITQDELNRLQTESKDKCVIRFEVDDSKKENCKVFRVMKKLAE